MSKNQHEYTITVLPSGIIQPFPSETTLAEALLDMGIALKTPCGGKGTCGKCRVMVEGTPEKVLACRTRITHDLTVHAEQVETDRDMRIPTIELGSRISAAVDIGTTTVRISLVDAAHESSFEVASFLNPQRRFGHDVISRIAAAGTNRGVQGRLIRKAVQGRLDHALNALGLAGDSIEGIVFSGNTTMLYLLFGLDVEGLGKYPYRVHVRDFESLSAQDIGLDSMGSVQIRSLPVLSAFIGGDLIGGLAHCRDLGITKNAFFIDLGTNGELFIMNAEGRPFATSCAMGPALEGMNISYGMTADAGAITHIENMKDTISYRMIGEGNPAGISGTALVDLLAILLDKGVISHHGAFPRSKDAPPDPALPPSAVRDVEEAICRLRISAGPNSEPSLLRLSHSGKSRELLLWGDIKLTQQDIRTVQLAKAASYAASYFLLKASGCAPGDIEHVIIAGAFGEHLNIDNFRRLGFIPEFANAQYRFLGNTSLKAAEKSCMDLGFLNRAAALRDRTEEVVLSLEDGFQEEFIRSLDFPS
jgi:uncharacterized 2Fe-2S/4Fe-4S cluster protein (DUF4445 family)